MAITSMASPTARIRHRNFSEKSAEPEENGFVIPEVAVFGIPHLDQQHQDLADIVISFRQNIGVENVEKLSQCFTNLLALINTHFADEEAEMEKSGYPHVAAHHEHHLELITKTKQIQKWVLERGCIEESDIRKCINEILRHMFLGDADFNTYLKSNRY